MSDSKADPLFRRAIEDDIPRLNELANHPEISCYFESVPPVLPETTRALLTHAEHGLLSLWSVIYGGMVIGGGGYVILGPGTRLDHSVLFFLFLDPDFQGTGIGRKTLEFLEDQARGEGFRRMECMVSATNLRAIRLYETAGFLHEGIKKEAMRIDGTFVDLVLMAKNLMR